MNQAHVIFIGTVQGVGYRKFIQTTAKEHAIYGWVRNLPDKSVEAIFQGEKDEIVKVIERCKKEHFFAQVRDAMVAWEQKTEDFTTFEIRHD